MQILPRLLYFGDVPVECSYHGSALLYRLLQNYPPSRLFIVEGNLGVSRSDRRLAGVEYASVPVGVPRFLRTRFAPWYSSWLTLKAELRLKPAKRLIEAFQPEAILTVTHGFSWIAAAKLANAHEVPLHVICHDDWPKMANLIGIVERRMDTTFGAVYQQAVSRLCVSPFMREEYRRRYASDGQVLYPSRARDCREFDAPPERLGGNDHQFIVAFAGTVNSPGYVRALKSVAAALEPLGGRLLIFGPLTVEAARRDGLERSNVELRGLLKAEDLVSRFSEEVDVLFVPMSFDSADRSNMEISFPSKLTDYTAVGLPILIYGPPYCSAVRWARENCGVAEVVDDEDQTRLVEALQRIARSPARRMALGMCAMDVGHRYFDYETVQGAFYRALVAGP